MTDYEIRPGEGVGPVRFGMTRDEVEALLGPPEDRETDHYEDGAEESWAYDDGRLEVIFGSEDGWRVGSFDVESEKTTLLGFSPIGLDEKALLAALEERDVEVVHDEMEGDPDLRSWLAEDLGLSFWMDEDEVVCVTAMVLYDDEGERPLWP